MAEPKSKKTNTASEPTKVFDVAPPGQTAAIGTSRPVIVGHIKTIKRDPMMAEQPHQSEDAGVVQEVLEEPIVPKTAVKHEMKLERVGSEPAEEPVEPEQTEEVISEEIIDEEEAAPVQTSQSAAVDAIIEASEVNSKKPTTAEDAADEKIVSDLTTSRKYYVKTRVPPGKRNLRWLIFFIFVIGVTAGWYFLAGPGKDMWAKDTTPQTTAPAVVAPVPAQKVTQANPMSAELATYNDPSNGISFQYPKAWQITSGKDADRPTVDQITLKSPKLTIKTGYTNVPAADAEVFLQTIIYIQPETFPGATDLSVCTTDSAQVDGKSLSLAYTNTGTDFPNVNRVFLAEGSCKKTGDKFNIASELALSKTLSTKEYVVTSEYIYTEDYLKKLGATTKEQVTLGQALGIVVTKENFKNTDAFKQFNALLLSTKSL